jgi:polyvinyl alcohol dehydrogenase (cytochrome)
LRVNRSLLLVTLLGAALVPAVSSLPMVPHGKSAPLGGDWPFYGHDLSNSRDAGFQGVTRLNAPLLQELWSVDPGGDVTGTPAVVDGVVYVGTYGGHVGAYSAKTGAPVWTASVGFDVSASVAVANGRVFVSDHGGRLDALDASTGALLWSTDLSNGEFNAQLYGSPTPVGTAVLQGVSSYQETDASVSGFQGAVAKVDQSSGAILWRTTVLACGTCNGGAVWSTPAVDPASNLVFVGIGNAYTAPADQHTDSMMALNYTSGSIVWSDQYLGNDIWTAPAGGPGPDFDFGASPNLFLVNGSLAVGEGQKSGQYHVVDAATGRPLWDEQLGQGSSVGGFLGSTAYHGGRIFGGFLNLGNEVDVGQLAVQKVGVNPPQLQGSGPTDINAFPTGGKVLAIDAATGAVAWQEPAVPTLSAAAVSGNVVLQGDLGGTLHAYDASTGAPLWAYPTGEPIQSGPAVAEGTVFVGTGSGFGVPAAGHHLLAFAPLAPVLPPAPAIPRDALP